ncbi:hypothetical protein VP1G_11100 [Cytospora mali]|uniref:Uncharacterized protein n=1 Tax=Cytospora mali TaxID=578113 RepID=A0A194V8Q1_CYTMA|nr:hypothetical protein VP1G_11100 [Valsa mali var. pyri (nom. inval.)]
MDPNAHFLRYQAWPNPHYNQAMLLNPYQFGLSHAIAPPQAMPPMQLPYRANGFECAPPHPAPPPTWGYPLQQGPYSCYNPQVTSLRPSNTWNTYAGAGSFGPGVWNLQNAQGGFNGTPFASSSAYSADVCVPESHPSKSHGWNQTYMWQAPPQQDRGESHLQQSPAAKRDHETSRARGRLSSPYRPSSRWSRVSDEKPAKASAPTTPRRSAVITASLRHGKRTPLKKVMHSAKMISGSIFPAVRRVSGNSSDANVCHAFKKDYQPETRQDTSVTISRWHAYPNSFERFTTAYVRKNFRKLGTRWSIALTVT